MSLPEILAIQTNARRWPVDIHDELLMRARSLIAEKTGVNPGYVDVDVWVRGGYISFSERGDETIATISAELFKLERPENIAKVQHWFVLGQDESPSAPRFMEQLAETYGVTVQQMATWHAHGRVCFEEDSHGCTRGRRSTVRACVDAALPTTGNTVRRFYKGRSVFFHANTAEELEQLVTEDVMILRGIHGGDCIENAFLEERLWYGCSAS